MKTLLSIITMTLISFLGYSQTSEGITITVTINNIKNDNGHVLVGLHSQNTFMKTEALQTAKSEIKEGKTMATFTNVQPGTYAIMAMHDANDNEKMDFEANGMPIETYAISNNPMSFGPPQFSEAKFDTTDKNLEFELKLK